MNRREGSRTGRANPRGTAREPTGHPHATPRPADHRLPPERRHRARRGACACRRHAGSNFRRCAARRAGGDLAMCAPAWRSTTGCLQRWDLRWDSLVAPPERWRERAGIRALVAEADALIASEYGTATHALLHDPRLSLTAPFWRERLEAADFDVCAALFVRRPVEVAASLSKREPFAPEKTLALWLHYLGEGERGSRGHAAHARDLRPPARRAGRRAVARRIGMSLRAQDRACGARGRADRDPSRSQAFR